MIDSNLHSTNDEIVGLASLNETVRFDVSSKGLSRKLMMKGQNFESINCIIKV
jgi:hypothetical protein